jgi:hypothetical protein
MQVHVPQPYSLSRRLEQSQSENAGEIAGQRLDEAGRNTRAFSPIKLTPVFTSFVNTSFDVLDVVVILLLFKLYLDVKLSANLL